jgi:hypothetical protein
MTPEEELAEMRRQYPYAQPETHMLVNGAVRLRCQGCKSRPVPEHWFTFILCDPCLSARLDAERAA